jgi:phosphatidylinositol alpha-mannosyltransferase
VHALAAGSIWDVPVIGRFIGLVRRRGYDTVLSFLVHANAVAAIGTRFATYRLIQSIQTTQPNPRWHWWVQRRVIARAEQVVVPSPSAAHVARQRCAIDDGKVLVIPNAVDVSAFQASPIPVANPAPVPYPIGFIGRLDPIKRIPQLVRSLLAVKQPVHLHIFGEGPERSEIAAAVLCYGLASRVTLHGAIPRPQEALAQIGLLVLPSAAEGFGLVLIEAMAARVPVVATDVPGIRDVVRDGINGLLVTLEDDQALAAAIDRTSGDFRFRQELIARAYDSVCERFTWERVMPMYRDLLQLDPAPSAR